MDQELLTNNFMGLESLNWFFGVVEDRNDPLRLGRMKVRVFGIHPADKSIVTTDDLPWAMPIQPIYSAAYAGVGHFPVGVLVGTIVFGFFADGREAQIPFVLGTIAGGLGHLTNTTSTNANLGFVNPATVVAGVINYLNPPDSTISSSASVGVLPVEIIAKCRIISPKLMSIFGLNNIQVAGLLGHLAFESGLRPNISYGKTKGGPPVVGPPDLAYGYGQWLGARLQAFVSNASSNNLDPQSDDANISFLISELKGSQRNCITQLKAATTVDDATKAAYFYYGFSGPGKAADTYLASIPGRIVKANLIYNGLTNTNVSVRGAANTKQPFGQNLQNSGNGS